MSTARGLLVPDDVRRPIQVVTWRPDEDGGALLTVLYRTIRCRTVDVVDLAVDGAPGGRLSIWVDDEGLYRRDAAHNTRIGYLSHGLGQPRQLVGPAVLTGGPDEDGNTQGLPIALLGDLRRALRRAVAR